MGHANGLRTCDQAEIVTGWDADPYPGHSRVSGYLAPQGESQVPHWSSLVRIANSDSAYRDPRGRGMAGQFVYTVYRLAQPTRPDIQPHPWRVCESDEGRTEGPPLRSKSAAI